MICELIHILAHPGYEGDTTPNFGLFLLDESNSYYYFEAVVDK
jgi:hypothetical protein